MVLLLTIDVSRIGRRGLPGPVDPENVFGCMLVVRVVEAVVALEKSPRLSYLHQGPPLALEFLVVTKVGKSMLRLGERLANVVSLPQ